MIDPAQDQTETVENTANTPPAAAQQPMVQNAPATAPSTPQPAQANLQPAQQQSAQTPSQSQQYPPKPAQPPQSDNQASTVSNAPQVHPAVQRAGVLRSVAQALAGGPRYTQTIDPQTGATVRTQAPLSRRDIGMAIALEAISGSLTGLAQRGPGATGRAAEAGFQQGQEQQQQAQQRQDQQAQQEYQNETQSLVRRANAMEVNSRIALNTAQSERYGVESLKDAVAQNSQLLSDYQDAGTVAESHISQDALSSGIQSGKYNATAQTAIPDGFTSIGGRYEQTFSIIANPAAKVPLTSEQAKAFGDAGVPGFASFKTGNIPGGVMVPGYMVANANQRVQAINLMKQDFSAVSDTLAKSSDKGSQELAQSVPSVQSLLSDPNNGPILQNALSKFQKYVSHSDWHGMDLYESLQQMAAPSKPDPRNPKQFIPNPDTGAAQTIAGAFGNGDPQKGWAILKAYHNETTPEPVTNENQAESVLADPDSSSKAKVQARNFLHLANEQKATQAAVEARAKQAADLANSADVPTLGEALAKGALTEDQIPGFSKLKPQIQAYLAEHHPNLDQSSLQLTAEERKRKDLATNALNNLSIIQTILQRRPDLLGVIQGRISQGKELAGTNDPDLASVNTALDNYALAATGAHGIRAVEARASAKQALLNGFKNGTAGIDSSIDTARSSLQEFANLGKPRGIDGSQYVYRSSGSQPSQSTSPGGQHIVPAGATPGRDAAGNIIGYRTATGQVVRF